MNDFVEYVELIPYGALTTYAIWAGWYLWKATKQPESVNPHIFEMIPPFFTTIGIFGTFLGIATGLYLFDVQDIENSIPVLLGGLKTAFIASIFGIFLYFGSAKWVAIIQNRNEQGKLSPEAIRMEILVDKISTLTENINDIFTTVDANNNTITVGNLFRDIYQESRKQSQALQSFSTDLAISISAGFEQILNNEDKGVLSELQLVRKEIELLGGKLSDPTTEMTQNVVKDLEVAMKNMIDEFKTSVSGSTKAEMERLASVLGEAGGALTSFPIRLQEMTQNLNENFRGLQEVVEQISKQTLSQSTESTGLMKKQVEEMSEILKSKVGDLQSGQEVLMTRQTENLTVSESLLSSFNASIENMKGLSGGINDTITKFNTIQSELSRASSQLVTVSNQVNNSTVLFKDAQMKFSDQNDQFIQHNRRTIEEIQSSLVHAKEVSTHYAVKFEIIENGLKSIFDEIQVGLDLYSKSVGSSIESYLGKYSEALTSTVQSLAGASEKQEDMLNDLTEQIEGFRRDVLRSQTTRALQ